MGLMPSWAAQQARRHHDAEGRGYFATMTDTGETVNTRPVTYNNGFSGMFSDMYGVGRRHRHVRR